VQAVEDAVDTVKNGAGVLAKKLVGVLSVVAVAVVNDMPPFSFVNGAVAIGQGIDAALKLIGVNGGVGAAMGDALKYVQETMTMLTASLTCAGEWAAGGTTKQQGGQALDSSAAVVDKGVDLARDTETAAANAREAARLKTAAEVAVRNGEKDAASSLTRAQAYYATKEAEYAAAKVKYAGKARAAKKLGVAVAIGQGIYDNIATGPGVVWEDNAQDAWTSGGDAFMACAARQMPSYVPVPARYG
jgi:hypothetical protein